MNENKNLIIKQLKKIKNKTIKNETEHILNVCPKYFYKIPSSATGKYHPKNQLGKGGLVRHVVTCVMVFESLKRNQWIIESIFGEKQINDYNSDLILSSLLLHDVVKNGFVYKEKTSKKHNKLAHDLILSETKSKEMIIVAKLVLTHMGHWYNEDYRQYNKNLRPLALMVHYCDYLGSRKWL